MTHGAPEIARRKLSFLPIFIELTSRYCSLAMGKEIEPSNITEYLRSRQVLVGNNGKTVEVYLLQGFFHQQHGICCHLLFLMQKQLLSVCLPFL